MDYFNHDERARQQAFARWRDQRLAFVVRPLLAWGVKPAWVTGVGVLLLGVACLLDQRHPLLIALALLGYCLLDGLDGPLARASGCAGEGGALLDVVADQLGVVLLSAAAVHHLGLPGVWAVLFSNFYLATIALVLLANARRVPLPRFLRLKYPFYLLYLLAMAGWDRWLTPLLILACLYYLPLFWLLLVRVAAGLDRQQRNP